MGFVKKDIKFIRNSSNKRNWNHSKVHSEITFLILDELYSMGILIYSNRIGKNNLENWALMIHANLNKIY